MRRVCETIFHFLTGFLTGYRHMELSTKKRNGKGGKERKEKGGGECGVENVRVMYVI